MKIDFEKFRTDVEQFMATLNGLCGYLEVCSDIAPPMSTEECDSLEPLWPSGIPQPLKDLWTLGSRQFQCSYQWRPIDDELDDVLDIFEYATSGLWGGIRLAPPEELFPANPEWSEWADGFKHADDDGLSYHLWSNCAMFHTTDCGDHLGIDPTKNPDDPPVAYLSHENASSGYICASFTEFLQTWQKLSFIGPEFLCYFVDQNKLAPPDWIAQDLRRVLSRQ